MTKIKINETNVATRRIVDFLTFNAHAFAYRHNILPIPIPGGGFRSGSKSGIPDVVAILPDGGRYLGVEVKRGTDRLRPEQEGFHITARKLGAIIILAKGKNADEIFDSFLKQWETYGY